MNPLLAAALEYASKGWRVVPLYSPRGGACDCHLGAGCPTPGKHPRTGHGKDDATTDADLIRQWWETWPQANIGIATGDGLLVLDVDPRHGGDDALHELEREHGELPATIRVKTGGGGEHIYFANPNGIGCSAGRLGEGLDTKGAGGYVLAPPSVHPSGRPYAWDVPPEEVALAEPPPWLLGLLARQNGTRPGRTTGEPIPEGCRDSTLLSLAGSMRRVGMTGREIEAALLVVNRERCKPPQDEAKVRELAARAGGYPAGAPRIPTADAAEAARELGDLLSLPSVGLAVAGCRVVGTGREASGDIYLSDGRAITFNPLRLAMSGNSLAEIVVSTVGAEPALKSPDARHAVALMRKIGEIVELVDEDADAATWGIDFLAAAVVLDVDMSDQAQRWAAFSRLRDHDPVAHARAAGCSIAKGSIVLRNLDGSFYVRTQWFGAHVRQAEDHLISPAQVAQRMKRVGWDRPGKKGRVKATRPGFSDEDAQSFYVVPPGWGDQPGDHVTPGDPSLRARVARARANEYSPGVTGSPGDGEAAAP